MKYTILLLLFITACTTAPVEERPPTPSGYYSFCTENPENNLCTVDE